MKHAITLLAILLTQSAGATVYFTAYDQDSGVSALVYSSSGGNFWQSKFAGLGMLGEQASGLCRQATPRTFIKQGLGAQEIVEALRKQCDQVGWNRYRLSVVTVDGEMSHYIAGQGCHENNIHCGSLESDHFTITGGGLAAGVLEKTLDYWHQLDHKTPFHCRLFKTLKNIYRIGGEKRVFKGASITLNHPQWEGLKDFKYRKTRSENEGILLEKIEQQMILSGYHCQD